MGLRGRKADPKKQELLGNPGKRSTKAKSKEKVVAINADAAKKIAVPEAPAFLNKEGRAEWDRLVPQLVQDRKVSGIHSTMLAAYCNHVGRAIQCEKNLEKKSHLYTTTSSRGGHWMPAAELSIATKEWKAAADIWKRLGLDHKRAATVRPPDEDEDDDDGDSDGSAAAAPDPNDAYLRPRRR